MAASGELPLDYMLRIMRDETVNPERRDHMARCAAFHAKLQASPHENKEAQTIIEPTSEWDRHETGGKSDTLSKHQSVAEQLLIPSKRSSRTTVARVRTGIK